MHNPTTIFNDFRSAWSTTENLFSALKTEDSLLAAPEHGLRHPLAFYLGHVAVFYVNKLRAAGLIREGIHPLFEELFAIGVDEHSWDDMTKNSRSWPSLSAINDYREEVYALVSQAISRIEDAAFDDTNPEWAILMAIEHERIHIETTSVLMREIPLVNFRAPENFPTLHPSSKAAPSLHPKAGVDYPKPEWVAVSGGEVRLGKSRNCSSFGWDCEYGEAWRFAEPFEVSKYLVSNGEFYEFVSDGGYTDDSYWTDEGAAWRKFRNRNSPQFWVDGGRKLRTCFEEIPMPWSWPVIANFHEAKAFANWRTKNDSAPVRLMTESEHHRMRTVVGPRAVSTANFDLRFGSEAPVDRDTSLPICDVVGNVWQWCEDIFLPLTGFRPHSLYPDYSTPSFDGKHQLLLGGSFASTGDATGPWNRNNFRRHFYQHAGIRLVRKP